MALDVIFAARPEVRMRDTQRSKVYAAERALKDAPDFETMDQVHRYVEGGVFESTWFKNRFPQVTFLATHNGGGARKARGGPCYRRAGSGLLIQGVYMNLPRWARSKLVILHELAHGLTPVTCAAHGREWCQIYLELVGRFMGTETATRLRDSFKAHGVRCLPKRVLSETQKAEMVERLKKYQKQPVAAKS